MKRFAIVYQCGIANVFDVTPKRCSSCQDRPGKDGLGRPCKACNGIGDIIGKPRRLLQGAFGECETFMRGAVAVGARPLIYHCDEAGDIADRDWTPGIGGLFAEGKSYA